MSRSPAAVHLVQLTEVELSALRALPALVEHLEAAKASTSLLPLTVAARRVRRRTADVAAAIASGALPAKRSGRTWRILASDADAWAVKGRA